MADHMATLSPARLCSADGKLCYYRRLEYGFIAFLALLAVKSSPFAPSLNRYVSLLRVPSSVQQSSVPLQQVRDTCSFCVIRVLLPLIIPLVLPGI